MVPTMMTFSKWLAGAMITWSGLGNQQSARIDTIAQDIVAVAFDDAEAPLFKGPAGRVRTAALLASIASFESGGFDPKVDTGERRGDSMRSYCMMQVNLGKRRVVMEERGYRYSMTEGWSGTDLLKDRTKCIRAALHIARASYDACGNLNGYTAGKCDAGGDASTARLTRGKVMAGKWIDTDVVIDALVMR